MRKIPALLLVALIVGVALWSGLCLGQEPEANPPPACPHPDVDKPHAACPDAECWTGCTDAGYENTCTQAVSANVIFAQCCFCCYLYPDEIYHGLVAISGNWGQFPEEAIQTMDDWISANCQACTLGVEMAHKGYSGHDPVDSQNVNFDWADQVVTYVQNVKIWVVGFTELPLPPAPTNRDDLSMELSFRGKFGNQALVNDPDCDIGGAAENVYLIGSDAAGEYLQDYFGQGIHGYLHGVVVVAGPLCCSHSCPTFSELGKMFLAIMIIAAGLLSILRRKRVGVLA